MTKVRGVTGGGIDGNKVRHIPQPKSEPKPYSISVGATQRIGQAQYPGARTGPLVEGPGFYQGRSYASSIAPGKMVGPTDGLDCRPGGNGREILRAGSQAKTPAPTSMGTGRSFDAPPNSKGQR
jgi:hypothetical protein